MARSKDLKVVITGDADKLDRELRRASGSLDKLGRQTRVTGSITSRGFAGMRVAAVGATAAFGGLALAGKKVVDAAIESEKSQARLQAQLKASGISYTAHAKEIDLVIQKHSQLAGLDDEDLQDAFTNIVRVTGDVDKSLRLVGLASDFARGKQIDVAKAGEIVAKVAGGNIGVLSRYGIKVREGASATEALGMLQQKFAGQAEAYGKTTGGSIDRAGVAFENLQETIGKAAAPAVEDLANKTADFVNEMQSGTGAGGRFADKLKDIWTEAKPIVTWVGRAIKNVATFAAEHPNVTKLAAAVVAVGAAVKTLKFVSSATGFTDLVKAGRGAAKALKRVLSSGGEAAGEAAAANAASSFSGRKGKFSSAGRTAGKAFSRGIGLGMIVGVAAIASEFADGLVDKVRQELGDRVGNAVQDAMPGGRVGRWGRDKLKGVLGDIFRNSGGIIPGQGNTDTVPAMLTPGEFVIRKQVVEKFGPTFFSAINSGKAPQMRTSGGIIARANAIDAKRYPYVWGGGHGGRGPDTGTPGSHPNDKTSDPNEPGYDCSGAVADAIGVSPRHSSQFASVGKPGPGSPMDTKIYSNNEHVWAVFNGKGWGTSRENPRSGPGWLSYNHRSGFVITHLSDGSASSRGEGITEGNDPETSEPGKKQIKADRVERAARSGSRAVNRIASKFGKGIAASVSGARSVGRVVEQADSGYGRSERFFGQVIGGQAGVFGDEDLGTVEGRAQRTTEVQELRKLKVAQLARLNKRKGLLKKAIATSEKQLKALSKARDKATGGKRTAMNKRIRAFEQRLTDLKGDLAALGESIADVKLDIGEHDKDLGELAQAPEAEAGPEPQSAGDFLSSRLAIVDAMERAGDLTPEQARAERQRHIELALAGAFGQISDLERLNLRGDLRDLMQAQAQATVDNTAALRDLKASIDAQLAFADRVSAIVGMEAVRALADVMSNQLGARVSARSSMPGSGALSRF